jgi:hypothetical protein
VYRLSVHFECSESPFAVAGIVAAAGTVAADIVVAVVAVGTAAVNIVVAVDIADIVAADKAAGLVATSCLVELPIPSLMMILITVIPLLKFSF